MKRYVLLVGGAGARLADALICAASAGVFPAERLNLLLADTSRGTHTVSLAAAKLADYARIHQAMPHEDGPFRTELAFSAWPKALPGGASTLADLTADAEADALLCQAMFDPQAASLDLNEGFHGRRMLGEVIFAGLLHEADQDPEDALACMADEMSAALDAGEEVRAVLVGSVCGGTGAAGIAALSRYLRRRTQERVHLGAILLGACADEQNASAAQEAYAAYARDGLCRTVCILALPQACRSASPAEYARLTDWLAVYALDILLHRPVWLEGLFTVKAPEGALGWDIFGKAAERYRLCYGGLIKAACAWVGGLGAQVEHRLRHPFFLRDGLFGWYAHFFRRMHGSREEQLELVATVSRLMNVSLIWLGGIFRTLPIDLRNASALTAARDEAGAHYAALTDLVSRLTLMDSDAKRTELYEDNLVYRSRNSADAAETEAALRRIVSARQELSRRETVQDGLNRRMGGAAAMDMLTEALLSAEAECDALRERYAEAVRRIDHAESIAAPEDQYRITDARTKLRRMEQHQLMLDSRLTHIREDVERARQAGLRFGKPDLPAAPAENAMLPPELAESLLLRDRLNRRRVEALWPQMILPRATLNYKMTFRRMRRSPAAPDAPVLSLLTALMENAMKEV